MDKEIIIFFFIYNIVILICFYAVELVINHMFQTEIN